MPEDDRALRARLDALEAEVKAEADASRARKDAALAKVREQRARDLAEQQALRTRQAELVTRRAAPAPSPRAGAAANADADDDAEADHQDDGLFARGRAALRGDAGSALALARGADKVKGELAKPRKTGDKSWKMSGLLSLAFGPAGWLYAGSFRESIPAAAGWLALAAIVSKLPLFSFLLLPVLLVVLPLSGIAGIYYALQYNRHGKRVRMFGKDEKPALPAGKRKQLPGK